MRAICSSVLWGLMGLALWMATPSSAAAQWWYYPSAPVFPPYYPPINYGPGNHFPYPFQRYYPNHPYAHLYYPYTYLPYSAYYHYPTMNVYGHSYNPYAPPPAFRVPVGLPHPHGHPGLIPLPVEELPVKPTENPPDKKPPIEPAEKK